jgi:hypothetical protein
MLVRLLLNQSRNMLMPGLVMSDHPGQPHASPRSPARWAWTGGHGTEP